MNEKDLVTLAISGLALTISVYGIYERRSATNRALRIRLTELIDALAKIKVDEAYVQDSSKSEAVIAALADANASRRMLLAAQAIDLLSKYRGRVTTPEYVNLATAVRETSDTATRRAIWELAVARLERESPFNQAAAWRGLAWCCFEQGDLDRARVAIRRSLDAQLPTDDIARHERLVILLSWFDFEFQESSTKVGSLNSVLDEAELVLRSVQHADVDWRLALAERVQLSRERLLAREAAGGRARPVTAS